MNKPQLNFINHPKSLQLVKEILAGHTSSETINLTPKSSSLRTEDLILYILANSVTSYQQYAYRLDALRYINHNKPSIPSIQH